VPRTYDPEFRRRVVELVRAGRPPRVVAAELGLAEATVYRWKAQDLIDRGLKPGTSTSERGELTAARRRITESWAWPPPSSSCGDTALPRHANSASPD
jgi:transposase